MRQENIFDKLYFYIIPEVRREVAIQMRKKGSKQSDIASKLSVTQGAVSQYINEKRGCTTQYLSQDDKDLINNDYVINNTDVYVQFFILNLSIKILKREYE